MTITFDGTEISGVTIDGTDVTEVTVDGSIAWLRDPELAGSSTFEINYDGPGVDFTSHISPGFEAQGVCYSPDNDLWYISEVTDSATPSTIHEYNADGTATGSTFQFSSATPNPNHANALQWHDGHLWCSEYNSDTVYKIDWSAGSVVSSFAIGSGVVDGDKLGAIDFIPTTSGGHKLLVGMWGSTNNAAYLVNYDQAVTDGTASGNIYRTLTDNIDTGRAQGFLYHDGALYINSDALPNTDSPNGGSGSFKGWGSYPTYKVGFPFADNISEGDPLISGRYVWCWLNADISYDDPIQDIGHDPNTGTFWTASEGTQTVYSGSETADIGTLPDTWSLWNTNDIGSHNNEWTRSLVMDYDVSPGKHDQHIFYQRQPCDVEVWVYDDLSGIANSDTKRGYISVAEPENAHNDTENTLAIHTGQSTSEYVAWNSTDGWHTTGVSRPTDTAQWVKFRWEMDGSQTDTFISTDQGSTWQSGGSYTYTATALGVLIPQVSTGVNTEIGPFTITPK